MEQQISDVEFARYANHIGMPEPDFDSPYPLGPPNFALLASLFRKHITAVPYENLCLHYSRERDVSLDCRPLLDRIINRRRGGYCMELNMIFFFLLRRLGFHTYMTGARLSQQGISGQAFTGWRHSIILVTFESPTLPVRALTYLVDVGFGGDGPIIPIALLPDVVNSNLGSQDTRLTFGPVQGLDSATMAPQPHLWSYWTRNSPKHAWKQHFCFSLLEFTLEDFKVMNYFASTHKESIQTRKLMVVKFLSESSARTDYSSCDSLTRSPSKHPDHIFGPSDQVPSHKRGPNDDCIAGKLILVDDTLKLNTGSKTQILKVCTTEEERVAVLETAFGIIVQEYERSSIRGSPVELAPKYTVSVNSPGDRKLAASIDSKRTGCSRVGDRHVQEVGSGRAMQHMLCKC